MSFENRDEILNNSLVKLVTTSNNHSEQPEKTDAQATPPENIVLGSSNQLVPNTRELATLIVVKLDTARISEEQFELYTSNKIHDSPVEIGTVNGAAASLPRNLLLKQSTIMPNFEGVWSMNYIPIGTRFGPLTGTIRAKNVVLNGVNRKYLWRIYKDNELFCYLDGYDTSAANWMHYVKFVSSSELQNLVACQHELNIYFYSINLIFPNQELFVWYCKEFAARLHKSLIEEQIVSEEL